MTVGLVGIGTMGMLAAKLLLEAGERLVVADANPKALQQARGMGAILADSPQAVAKSVDIILLLLPGPRQIEAVVAGEDGLLKEARPSQVIIDMSTVDPETTKRMALKAKSFGIDYLDAPILGRPSAAGSWVLAVGGEAEVVERCQPVLSILGKKIIHVGSLGAGNTLKLLNALMFSAINAMTAEMMAISQKAGLAPNVLFDTISASDAATVSGLFKEVGSKIVARDFAPTFPIDLLCKDNGLAVAMASDLGAPSILGGTIQTLNELARARGLGKEDTSAMVKLYESLLDIESAGVEQE